MMSQSEMPSSDEIETSTADETQNSTMTGNETLATTTGEDTFTSSENKISGTTTEEQPPTLSETEISTTRTEENISTTAENETESSTIFKTETLIITEDDISTVNETPAITASETQTSSSQETQTSTTQVETSTTLVQIDLSSTETSYSPSSEQMDDTTFITESSTNASSDSPISDPSTPTTTASTSTENTSTPKNSSTPKGSSTSASTSTTTEITTPFTYFEINIECNRGTVQTRILNSSEEVGMPPLTGRFYPPYNETIKLTRPLVSFDFENSRNEEEVQVVFDNIYYYDIFLVYYPGFLDATELTNENIKSTVNCQIVVSTKILVRDLVSSTVYTFCALIRHEPIQTPFQCKSYQTQTPFKRQTWIYQEQKIVILSSFLLLILFSLVIGSIMTYFLIRRMPVLIRGSKRVVMVNNRNKDVIIMPSESRNNSLQKESASTSIENEPPTYLTPLPRKTSDNR